MRQNPNSAGSVFLSIIAIVLMLVWGASLIVLIIFAFSLRRIFKAKKAKENKKFIMTGFVFMTISFVLILVNGAFFVIYNLQEAGAI